MSSSSDPSPELLLRRVDRTRPSAELETELGHQPDRSDRDEEVALPADQAAPHHALSAISKPSASPQFSRSRTLAMRASSNVTAPGTPRGAR